MMGKSAEHVIDLTVKGAAQLDARLEGVIAHHLRTRNKRMNWDAHPNAELRKRIADSWEHKNDLYTQGDSFHRFATKMNIDRNVLKRFLDRRYKTKRKRGRKSFLSESVMRHLCEGTHAI